MNKDTELLKNYLEMCSRLGCINCPLLRKAKNGCTNYVLSHLDEAAEAINNWVENQNKKTGWERNEEGRCYITQDGTFQTECGCQVCDANYNKANYFTSEKLAKNIDKFQTICRQIFRWIAENDPDPVTKEDRCSIRKTKYGIGYDYDSKCLRTSSYIYIVDNSFALSNKRTALELIETFKDELIWLFTEFEFFEMEC